MKSFKLVLALGLMAPPASFGSVRPDYILSKDVEIEGVAVSPDGMAAYANVRYWIQPCAGQKFAQFVVGDYSNDKGVRFIRVGVLISDSGVQCLGATIAKVEQLVLVGPFGNSAPDIAVLR